MDRRQQKTRAAIIKAFSKLIEKKHYINLTVQDIIDEANIGRSTFYAHFETKDDLLKTLCTDIFKHVFSDELMSERNHDFSDGGNSLEAKLTHILHHVKDSETNIAGILSCESGELFMGYFKEHLAQMFSKYLNKLTVTAPADFVLNHFVGSFAETVKWWVGKRMEYTPEETVRYYIEVSGADRITETCKLCLTNRS